MWLPLFSSVLAVLMSPTCHNDKECLTTGTALVYNVLSLTIYGAWRDTLNSWSSCGLLCTTGPAEPVGSVGSRPDQKLLWLAALQQPALGEGLASLRRSALIIFLSTAAVLTCASHAHVKMACSSLCRAAALPTLPERAFHPNPSFFLTEN